MQKLFPMKSESICLAWGDFARAVGEQFGVQPSLVLSMIEQESRGDILARSRVNARGLMQIRQLALDDFNHMTDQYEPVTHREVQVNPHLNVYICTWYFGRMLEQTKDIATALRAYNVGLGTIRKKSGEPGLKYSREVLARQPKFELLLVK